MAGIGPNPVAQLTIRAAPVGVSSSVRVPSGSSSPWLTASVRARRRTTAGPGTGQHAVRGPDRAGSQRDRADREVVEVEGRQSGARADDVGDRVERTHFVEVHVLGSGAVHGRFRLSQDSERGLGLLLDARRQGGALQE